MSFRFQNQDALVWDWVFRLSVYMFSLRVRGEVFEKRRYSTVDAA